jgi:energy-coupling factor transporter ATP-binding protein EcfA2
MARGPDPFVYFTQLTLTNVRSFGKGQILDLTDAAGHPARWTLILGENGVGKTTLLQCLALMRPVLSVGHNPKTNAPEIAALARTGETTVSLEAAFSAGCRLTQPQGRRQSFKTRARFAMKGNELDTIRPHRERRPQFTEPLVIGYGAGRHSSYRSGETTNVIPDSTGSLFDPSLELSDAAAILQDLDYVQEAAACCRAIGGGKGRIGETAS